MGKIIMPMQYFGLGDVIFEQTLIRSLMSPDDKVIWGVEPAFVEGLNRAYPDFIFIDYRMLNIDYERHDAREITVNGVTIYPFRWADCMLEVPYRQCMMSKYMLYDMDWQRWKEKAMWRRDYKKENELFAQLGLHDCGVRGDKFNLINRYFKTDSSGVADINVNNGNINVEMKIMDGYSLFDWAGVIERASEIHTVSTSIIYLIEQLKIKAPVVDLYLRKGQESDFANTEYLLQTHKYIKHN